MSDEARGVALVVAAVTSLQFGAGFAVTLFDELGSTLAPVCAFVIRDTLPHAVTATFAQEFGQARGIRVMTCRDIAEARAWLDLVTAGG